MLGNSNNDIRIVTLVLHTSAESELKAMTLMQLSCGWMVLWVSSMAITGSTRRIVDLTHTLDKNAPKYPVEFFGLDSDNFTYFKMTTLGAQFYEDVWVAARKVEYFEHQGTHIDAPFHFGSGRQTLDEIPPERLIGPGVVIDVRDKVSQNPDYAVTVKDIREHEKLYGKIPPGAIVCMNSGWAAKYPDPVMVFGSTQLNSSYTFRFPGFAIGACKMLLNQRQVSVVGVDTPSVDPGNVLRYDCHAFLQPNQVPLLEYVANLDSIPVRGTTMVLGAVKMREGTGGPVRIFAVMEDTDDTQTNTASCVYNHCKHAALIVFTCALVWLFRM